MKKFLRFFLSAAFAALLLLSSFGTLDAQNTEVWRAGIVPFKEFKQKLGRYYSPRVSPADKNIVSYELETNIGMKLYIADFRDNRSVEIHAIGSRDNRELDWSPQLHSGMQWFVFISAGTPTANKDIYLASVDEPIVQYRMTSDPSADYHPRWSPDGNSIVFVSNRSGASDLFVINDVWGLVSRLKDELAGGNKEAVGDQIDNGKWVEHLTETTAMENFPSWSSDSKYVLYSTNANAQYGIAATNVISKKEIGLVSNSSVPLSNPTLSPDGRSLAFYRMDSKQGGSANMAIASISYINNAMVEAKMLWTNGEVEKFNDVKADSERGPLWSSSGNLFFLNETRCHPYTVCKVPSIAFQTKISRDIILCNVYDYHSMELFGIREIDIASDGDPKENLLFTATLGPDYGVFTTMPQVRQPLPENESMIGILGNGAQPVGNIGTASTTLGGEIFYQFPIAGPFSLYAGVAAATFEGSDIDADGRTWSFVSPGVYALVMPGYRLPFPQGLNMWIRAGGGFMSLDSENPATKGTKLLFPVALQAEFPLSSSFAVTGYGRYIFSNKDLDGLRRNGAKDNFFSFSLGIGYYNPFSK